MAGLVIQTFEQSKVLFLCVWLTKAVVRHGIIASLGEQKGRYDIGSCFVVVDPNRLAYWLGKLVDMSQSRKKAPNKLALCSTFLCHDVNASSRLN